MGIPGGSLPGTCKWNKIEHRRVSFISLDWRGEPLVSLETSVNLIAATTAANVGRRPVAMAESGFRGKIGFMMLAALEDPLSPGATARDAEPATHPSYS
jgi:hypothetical protein